MAVKTTQTISDQDIVNFAQHKDDIRVAAEQAKKVMADEAGSAAKTIADSAGLAVKAIAEAAAVAVRVVSIKNADDHDLLIELKTQMSYLRSDILALSSGVTQKIANLETTKADKKDFEELHNEIHGPREDRIRTLENKVGNFFIYVILLLSAVAGIFALVGVHLGKG